MKKLLVIFTIMLISFVLADKLQITTGPNIRVAPNSKATLTNASYDVLAVFGDYAKVEVAVTKEVGWMWTGVLPVQKTGMTIGETYEVGKKGVTLRETIKGKKIGGVAVGSPVKILEVKITWYKIILGWIYHTSVKLIK